MCAINLRSVYSFLAFIATTIVPWLVATGMSIIGGLILSELKKSFDYRFLLSLLLEQYYKHDILQILSAVAVIAIFVLLVLIALYKVSKLRSDYRKMELTVLQLRDQLAKSNLDNERLRCRDEVKDLLILSLYEKKEQNLDATNSAGKPVDSSKVLGESDVVSNGAEADKTETPTPTRTMQPSGLILGSIDHSISQLSEGKGKEKVWQQRNGPEQEESLRPPCPTTRSRTAKAVVVTAKPSTPPSSQGRYRAPTPPLPVTAHNVSPHAPSRRIAKRLALVVDNVSVNKDESVCVPSPAPSVSVLSASVSPVSPPPPPVRPARRRVPPNRFSPGMGKSGGKHRGRP